VASKFSVSTGFLGVLDDVFSVQLVKSDFNFSIFEMK